MRIGGLFYKQVTLTSYLKVDAQWHHKRMSGVSLDRIHHLVDRWALGEVGLYYFKEVQWGSSGGFWVVFFRPLPRPLFCTCWGCHTYLLGREPRWHATSILSEADTGFRSISTHFTGAPITSTGSVSCTIASPQRTIATTLQAATPGILKLF